MLPGFGPRTSVTRSPAAVLTTLAVIAGGGIAACSSGSAAREPAAAFAKAWSANELRKLTLLDDEGEPLSGDQAQRLLTTVRGELSGAQPKVTIKGDPAEKGNDATVPAKVSWPLIAGRTWVYDTTIRLRKTAKGWRVVFGAATVHPDLTSTDSLTLQTTPAERGPILAGDGQPIVTQRPVVVVGVQPSEVKDIPATVAQLSAIINTVEPGLTFPELPDKIKSAKPDAFVDVVTLRREKYDQIRSQLRALESTHFQEASLPLAPTSAFARALLGSTGEVTREIMDKHPGKYRVGDVVGTSGLQQRYDDVLRGTPGLAVTIAGASGGNGKRLFTSDPRPGLAVKTSLDPATQTAADAALAGQTRNTALVAVRVSDGAVLAVANGANGPNRGQVDLALTAQVPPGSTFKTVTALGALDQGGVTADTIVPCPKTLTVGGRTVKNANDSELGDVPLRVDFAKSCNTAFAALAERLGADGLAKTAASLGIGATWEVGTEVFTGTVGRGGSAEERAAAAFGQGTTLVSPAALAGAAAALARGQFKQPKLVLDPAPASPAPDGPVLNAEAVAALRAMMREVVTAGTATALAGSGEVYGKTGTAEFDSADPARTHSLFLGYRGDLAFAVLVEAAGSGDGAVPLAAAFLKNLG